MSREKMNEILRDLTITPELTDPKQMVVALFCGKSKNERQDMMLLHPSSLTLISSYEDEEAL